MAVSYTATVATFDYGFDFDSQFIYIDAGLAQIPVGDLYTAVKEAQASSVGVVYDLIATGTGLDELDPGIQTFLTIRMFDEWELRSLRSSGKVTTNGGNIVKDNGKDPFFDDGNVFYIAFFSQAGIKTTVAVGSGVLPSDVTAIADATRVEMDDNSTQLATIVDDTTNSIPAQITALNDFSPSADILENGETYDEVWRVDHSALAGKASKAGSTETFRDAADTKDRITATTDTNGQRLIVTTDGT